MKSLRISIILISLIVVFSLLFKHYYSIPAAPKLNHSTTSSSIVSNPKISENQIISPIAQRLRSKPQEIELRKKTSLIKTPTHSTVKSQHIVHKASNLSGINVNKLVSAASAEGLQPKALKSALNAYTWALNHGKLGYNKETLTVVDFTLPSYEKRMWVLNLRQNKVLMKLHTTQGSGSGLVYASRFSNTSRSQATSLGLYTTSEKYYGKHGISMRLDGLQRGINNNARNRSIVIHEAPYASASYIKANHRAGRSWGCFAVDPARKNILLNQVQGGSAFFAYSRAIEKTPIVSNGPISI